MQLGLAKLLQPRLVAGTWRTGSIELVPDVVCAVGALLEGLEECWTIVAKRWSRKGPPDTGLLIGAVAPGRHVPTDDDVLWAVRCPTEHAACAVFAGMAGEPNLLIACWTELDAHVPFSWEVTPKNSGFGSIWVRWEFRINAERGASALEALATCLMKGCETIIMGGRRFPQFIPMDQRCDDWGCLHDYGHFRVDTRKKCIVS